MDTQENGWEVKVVQYNLPQGVWYLKTPLTKVQLAK